MNEQHGTALNNWSAIVLAAGGSSRFGAHKLLADLAGDPLLRRTVSAVCAIGFAKTIVVAGAEHTDVEAILAGCPCTVVHAPNWSEGMSASIRTGIAALSDKHMGLFLFLGDMPIFPAELCEDLARLARDSGYAARPICGDVPGHPVAFTKGALPNLMALIGDEGAGSLLRGAGPKLHYLPTTDEGAILDVDTPSDLARAERLWKSRFTSERIDNAISRGDLPRP